MKKLLVISYDAVGDKEFNRLMGYPNFAALAKKSAVVHKVKSIFISNTYPVHTSVVTGKHPCDHGLINNTDVYPTHHPRWWYDASRIKAQTLWDAAYEKGLTTAAVLWPVTGKAKKIKWNVPESMAQPGESQIVTNFKNGSKLLQLQLFLRHRHLMDGIKQPALDAFTTASMVDILKEKQPDLALVHLTAFDSLCHENGLDSPVLADAFQALDNNLGALLKAAGEERNVIVFSDHAQLPAEKPIFPNAMLAERFGLLKKTEEGYEGSSCYFECCGGSAFFQNNSVSESDVVKIKTMLEDVEGFNRYLTNEELRVSGRLDAAFGFCAKPGYGIHNFPSYEQGNHGFPLDYEDYDVFYMGSGPNFCEGTVLEGGSLLDIAPLASEILGLSMPQTEKVRRQLLK